MEEIRLEDINLYDLGNEIQIAGTIWSGKGMSFITILPEKKEDFKNLKLLPMSLEDWQKFIRQTDLLETEILSNDENGLTKILLRKSQRQIDTYIQWAVFRRDNYTCRYCGRTGIPLTVDHIDLWEDGGPTIIENLISTCRSCNKDRGRIKYVDWINSPIYKKKSKTLTSAQKQANLDIINDLPNIEKLRVQHIKSR
jgi:hypothetical protein